jgi:hypothetical protein
VRLFCIAMLAFACVAVPPPAHASKTAVPKYHKQAIPKYHKQSVPKYQKQSIPKYHKTR